MQQDGKRPDGTTLLPWTRGKPMALDVTVLDTYTESHIDQTASEANKESANKIVKYGALSASHIFFQWQSRLLAPGTSPPLSCYVSQGKVFRKASNSKSDLQGHSKTLAMVPFDKPHTIFLVFR